jgi:hypothetical protein
LRESRDQITKLQAELAECRKPSVEVTAVYHGTWLVPRSHFQRERNARVASDKRAATAESYMRGFSQLAFTLCRRWHADEGHAAKNVNECREGWCGEFAKLREETTAVDWEATELLCKRADEAERRLGELREFVLTRYLETRTGVGVAKPREHGPATDAQFEEAFAAFLAEKGTVVE